MNCPLPSLMRVYRTDDVFVEKTAGALPLSMRVGELAIGSSLLARQERAREARQLAQAEMMNTAFRMIELARMEHAIDNAGHTPAPMILPHGYDLPVGMTEGMVRIASAAGGDMAKCSAWGPYRAQPPEGMIPEPTGAGMFQRGQEGIKELKSSSAPAPAAAPGKGLLARAGIDSAKGLKRTALGLGGTALGVGAGLYALHKGLSFLSGQPHTPTYNQGGYQLAQDVNEYGQTQGRLPTYR